MEQGELVRASVESRSEVGDIITSGFYYDQGGGRCPGMKERLVGSTTMKLVYGGFPASFNKHLP